METGCSNISFDSNYELVASFRECQRCSPWPSWRPRAVAGCGAVRKIGGTPRQHGGWKAYEPCMFCSCTQRCAGRTSLHFLPMFQEVRPISKTRNQLIGKISKCFLNEKGLFHILSIVCIRLIDLVYRL